MPTEPQKNQQLRQPLRGSIVHDHAHYTNEGFGSLARNMIYPIIHIALSCSLQPYISNALYDYNTSRPNYKTHLQSITAFLSLPEHDHGDDSTVPSQDFNQMGNDDCIIVKLEINTWNDAKIGSCCGDAKMIAKELSDYLNRCNNHAPQQYWWDIRLIGAIRCMDPTPIVYEWLQNLSATWTADDLDHEPPQPNQDRGSYSKAENGCDQTSVTDCLDATSAADSTAVNTDGSDHLRFVLRIVAHVRVPEDFTSQSWKDDNSVEKLYLALDTILQYIDYRMIDVKIDIFTEEQFALTSELEFIERYQKHPSVEDLRVHRGTTDSLLNDIKDIVRTADIFIPSSSYFSAFCGYLFPPPGIIVLSHSSRWQYFASHEQLMLNKVRSIQNANSRVIDIAQTSPTFGDNESWQCFISKIQKRKIM